MNKKKWGLIGLSIIIVITIIMTVLFFVGQSESKPKEHDTKQGTGLKEGQSNKDNSSDKDNTKSDNDSKKKDTNDQKKSENKQAKDKKKDDNGAISAKPNDKPNEKKQYKNVEQSKSELEDNIKTYIQYSTMPQIEEQGPNIYDNLKNITSKGYQDAMFDEGELMHPIKNEIGPFDYKTDNYKFDWQTKHIDKNTKKADAVVSYTTKLKTTGNQSKDKQMYREYDQKQYVKLVREHGKLVIDESRS